MLKFILGIAVAVAVHQVGWARIERAARTTGDVAHSAFKAGERELRASNLLEVPEYRSNNMRPGAVDGAQ